jgi:hypothetical protein
LLIVINVSAHRDHRYRHRAARALPVPRAVLRDGVHLASQPAMLTRFRLPKQALAVALVAFACREQPSASETAALARPVASRPPTLPPASTGSDEAIATTSEVDFERGACKDAESSARFFPLGLLWPGQRAAPVDELARSWFSRVLFRMAEPSLSCGRALPHTYRFMVIPTWGPPAAVRITVTASELSAVVLSGQGGYDPGHPRSIAARPLGNREREEVLAAIARANFWKLPTQDLEHRGHDGSEWLLEGRTGDRYHVVDRWSPEPGPFRELCLAFARLGEVPTG